MKAVLLTLLLAACQSSQPPTTTTPTTSPSTPTVVAPTPKVAPLVLAVSKGGEQLGTITIVHGELGTLRISGAIAAKWLTDAWAEVQQQHQVQVHVAVAASDAGQHRIATKTYKPTDADYGSGVQQFLREKDFEVEIVAAPPSGGAA